jgi:ribonuclease HI
LLWPVEQVNVGRRSLRLSTRAWITIGKRLMNQSVRLFTDGACIGNPGPGGWGFVLKHGASGRSKEGSGGEHATTNNRMEILAVIRGLEALKDPCDVALFSDSEYVVKAISGWMARWKSFGWKKSAKGKEQVRNVDLWIRLDELLQIHNLNANWVRGHVGHIENERCDRLATSAAAKVAGSASASGDSREDRGVVSGGGRERSGDAASTELFGEG